MQSRPGKLLIAASLFALAACAPPAPPADTQADETAMKAGTAAWVEAYNAGDADKIVALYAQDAFVMPPGAPPASGHAAIREFLVGDIAASKKEGVTLLLGDETSGVSGPIGWHSGTFKVADASGATVGTGKYMEVWRKADGKWLILRDIWNNDAPPAPAAAAQEPAG